MPDSEDSDYNAILAKLLAENPTSQQAATAVRNSVLRFCPDLRTDGTLYARLIWLLLSEARTGQYRTEELVALIGEDVDRATLRFEFRNAICPYWKAWAMTCAKLEEKFNPKTGSQHNPRF